MTPSNPISTDIAPAKATRREWIGLAVIALPCLLYSMDLNVLNLAIPALTEDLRPTATQLLWIVDIYGFLLAGFLITMGTLGDRIGRRRLLLIGAGAFGLASVLAAFATSAEMLIVSRAILGITAATLAPSTLSLIRNMFHDPQERTLAIGIWIGCFSSGSALGPVFGGLLLEYFWWGSVFLLAVPVMALLLILGPALLPEYRDPSAHAIDLPSAFLATLTVLSMIFGIKHIAIVGLDAPSAGAVLLSLGFGTVFIRRQRSLADPMIDLTLFRNPQFSAALGINIMGVFAAFGSFLFITQYLQLVAGLGPLAAGFWIAPSGLVFVAGSLLAPILVRRYPARAVLMGGFSTTAAGYLVLAFIQVDSSLWMVLAGFMLFCAGLAPMGTLTTDLVMSSAPPEKAGTASGISETSFEFGAALGVAVLGSILTAVYRVHMDTAPWSPAVTSDMLAAARDTLGAAVSVATESDGDAGAEVLATARSAFTEGMRVAAAASALLAVTAVVCCAGFLGRGPNSDRSAVVH